MQDSTVAVILGLLLLIVINEKRYLIPTSQVGKPSPQGGIVTAASTGGPGIKSPEQLRQNGGAGRGGGVREGSRMVRVSALINHFIHTLPASALKCAFTPNRDIKLSVPASARPTPQCSG